jgi:hypothetical protein
MFWFSEEKQWRIGRASVIQYKCNGKGIAFSIKNASSRYCHILQRYVPVPKRIDTLTTTTVRVSITAKRYYLVRVSQDGVSVKTESGEKLHDGAFTVPHGKGFVGFPWISVAIAKLDW